MGAFGVGEPKPLASEVVVQEAKYFNRRNQEARKKNRSKFEYD